MTVTHVWTKPPKLFCERLQEFERQFNYPLNANQRFRIEHSFEYERFFRAMGSPVTVVAEKNGNILGVLSATVRTLSLSETECENWLYIGDVKIDEASRSRHVLERLFIATQSWVGTKCSKGYAVVMDGTGVTPHMYTGRVGIPTFRAQQSVKLFAFATKSLKRVATEQEVVKTPDDSPQKYKHVGSLRERHLAPNWSSTVFSHRSCMNPVWLSVPRTGCVGLLEDTRRAKRLYDSKSHELLYAHLSNLQYNSINDIVPIIFEAGNLAYTNGNTDLLVAVPARESNRLKEFVDRTEHDVFSSTVYATEKTEGYDLPISSSEI
ncbi:MAG: hypothetical protein OXG24_09275 [Gammaproteobacteria bacterium]|nr:hypothetical protein [Gammaproteobacteria bacterium]